MRNHRFYMYKRSEPSELGNISGDDFIRISDELIQKINHDLKKHKFISRNTKPGEEVDGLCEVTTLLDETGIIYLKESLLSQSGGNKEIKKLISFIERCSQQGNVIVHINEGIGTLSHDFALLCDIPNEINYNDFRDEFTKVHDQFIREYYNVFEKVEMYWNDMHTTGKGFNYYGVTILSPEISENLIYEITKFLENNESEEAEYFIGEEYDALIEILNKSVSESKYIIHFGI